MFKAVVLKEGEGIVMVKGVPYGGPLERDAHGQYFTENTNFLEDIIPLPPVFHFHGAKTGSSPTPVGETLSRHTKNDGVWYKVKLFLQDVDDLVQQKANMLWEAAKKGKLFASSGAVEAAIKIAENGEILQWLVGELSLINTSNPHERPASFHATAIPVKMENVEVGDHTLKTMEIIENTGIGDKGEETNIVATVREVIATTLKDIFGIEPTKELLTRSKSMPDEREGNDQLTSMQEQITELMTRVAAMSSDLQQRDAQIAELQGVITAKSAEVEMKTHETQVDAWIKEGKITPAEREPLLTVMSFAFQADTSTKGEVGFAAAVKSWIDVMPVNPAIGNPAGVFNNTGTVGAGPLSNGGTVDPTNIERLKRYADLS